MFAIERMDLLALRIFASADMRQSACRAMVCVLNAQCEPFGSQLDTTLLHMQRSLAGLGELAL